jgi:hypothetical protein
MNLVIMEDVDLSSRLDKQMREHCWIAWFTEDLLRLYLLGVVT